jgi:hypothetical protein
MRNLFCLHSKWKENLKEVKLEKGFMSFNIILLAALFLFGFSGYAQVSSKIDTTSIRIGEQFNYEITVDQTKDVRFPKFETDSLNRIGVVTSNKIDSLKNQLIKKYTLTSFDSGRYVIPGQEIYIRDKRFLTDQVIIDVATVPVDTIKQPLYHIKQIENEPYLFSDYLNYFWGLIALLIVIGVILYFVLRDKPTEEEIISRIPPFDTAKMRLLELDKKELITQNKIKTYYVELTDIVRTFIEREMNIPALESTTDELLETIIDFNNSSQLNIPSETMLKLKQLLKEADLVKFAKSKPLQNEIALHRVDAEGIIDTLHPKKVEPKAEENDRE